MVGVMPKTIHFPEAASHLLLSSIRQMFLFHSVCVGFRVGRRRTKETMFMQRKDGRVFSSPKASIAVPALEARQASISKDSPSPKTQTSCQMIHSKVVLSSRRITHSLRISGKSSISCSGQLRLSVSFPFWFFFSSHSVLNVSSSQHASQNAAFPVRPAFSVFRVTSRNGNTTKRNSMIRRRRATSVKQTKKWGGNCWKGIGSKHQPDWDTSEQRNIATFRSSEKPSRWMRGRTLFHQTKPSTLNMTPKLSLTIFSHTQMTRLPPKSVGTRLISRSSPALSRILETT